MKIQIITSAIILLSITSVSAQENWELPMVKDKIVFDFTSPKIEGKSDLCEIYTNMDFNTAIMKKCMDLYINKSLSRTPGAFGTKNKTLLTPQLWGSAGSSFKIPECISGRPDTIVGTLNMGLETAKFFTGTKGGDITCLFRIILFDDHINMKFKGFEIRRSTIQNAGAYAKSVEKETKPLEEEYKNMQTKKTEKEFWLEFKEVIDVFYKIIEGELSRRRGALDFDE
jgi:hypothetical protein